MGRPLTKLAFCAFFAGAIAAAAVATEPPEEEPAPVPTMPRGIAYPEQFEDEEQAPPVEIPPLDQGPDGQPVPNDPYRDSDGDGVPDSQELIEGTNPSVKDSDGDGIPDAVEAAGCTSPTLWDTDGDGLPDSIEPLLTLDPCDPTTYGESFPDGDLDFDFDGLDNQFEIRFGLKPANSDTDGDGVIDGEEYLNGSNPNYAADNGRRGPLVPVYVPISFQTAAIEAFNQSSRKVRLEMRFERISGGSAPPPPIRMPSRNEQWWWTGVILPPGQFRVKLVVIPDAPFKVGDKLSYYVWTPAGEYPLAPDPSQEIDPLNQIGDRIPEFTLRDPSVNKLFRQTYTSQDNLTPQGLAAKSAEMWSTWVFLQGPRWLGVYSEATFEAYLNGEVRPAQNWIYNPEDFPNRSDSEDLSVLKVLESRNRPGPTGLGIRMTVPYFPAGQQLREYWHRVTFKEYRPATIDYRAFIPCEFVALTSLEDSFLTVFAGDARRVSPNPTTSRAQLKFNVRVSDWHGPAATAEEFLEPTLLTLPFDRTTEYAAASVFGSGNINACRRLIQGAQSIANATHDQSNGYFVWVRRGPNTPFNEIDIGIEVMAANPLLPRLAQGVSATQINASVFLRLKQTIDPWSGKQRCEVNSKDSEFDRFPSHEVWVFGNEQIAPSDTNLDPQSDEMPDPITGLGTLNKYKASEFARPRVERHEP